ncbi:peptide/nickel transport system permease protein [Vibrio xiamenensis]|uniref:Peptide/nickel transport system permease protein n=1 Tax=Vibrio xiamenensis TaxID=861298 RepID=A0A1G7WA35_9VIBR|nr:ABC transporter permease [Vibrio xiamenensis]SDG68804.1 peptide/nickel transport system permease protein [Vibrio xiamenensis]
MLKFILKRIYTAIPTLFLISLFIFGLQKLIPGDPALILAGEDRSLEAIAYIRDAYHLNEPIINQYLYWLGDALQGDLGTSIRSDESVTSLLLTKLPVTIELSIFAMLFAIVISIPMSVIAAVKKNSGWDFSSSLVALAGQSIPNFWLGFMMILLVSVRWGLLPASGYVGPTESLVQNLQTMIMPAFVLGTGLAATLFRHSRGAMLEVLAADFIRTARAKGVSRKVIYLKHALRNALIPVVTMATIQFGELLGGAVLTEQVFTIPGLGKLIVDSVFNRDFPVVQGVVMFSALMFIVSNIVADIAYYVLDPKLRHREVY